MSTGIQLAAKYALFCIIAMSLNLGAQFVVDISLAPPLWLSMGIGTGVGLLAKYIFDRDYIFNAGGTTLAKDTQRFAIYSAMGALTTLVFWGMELAFAFAFCHPAAKYVGGVLGLTAGYLIKYQLDKRWVFAAK